MNHTAIFRKINHSVQCLDKKIGHIRFLTGNSLKIIAVLSMVIDHFVKIVLAWFIRDYWGELHQSGQLSTDRFIEIDNFIRFQLGSIGVIAFPLFCFLLSEGFRYTKNRKRYIGLMLVFALISEIPFDMGFFAYLSKLEGTFPFYWKYQNVFFTLFLGLLALEILEKLSCATEKSTDKINWAVLRIISVAAIAAAAEGIRCDYGSEGILYIVAFYLCRKNRIYQILLFLFAYIVMTGNQPSACLLLACLIILLYNGKRGKLKLKYFFYVFYPAHIMLFYLTTLGLEKFWLK